MVSTWKVCSLTESQTFAFYLDVLALPETLTKGQRGLMQFKTLYRHHSGHWRLRVTTTSQLFARTLTQMEMIENSFDQEAASIIFARKVIEKSNSEKPKNVLRWLDKSLINFLSFVSTYQRRKPETVMINKQYQLYPQFMYNFRRSQYLKYFGYSPDESTFHKYTFLNENCQNSILMFQPMLFEYSMNTQQRPVLLDISSLNKEYILLLDTFFYIIIWRGEKIAKWVKQGYQDMDEYKDFKTLLEMPHQYAEILTQKDSLTQR